MQLELDDHEARILYQVARARLRELRVEVRHDRNSESRRYLRRKEAVLHRVVAKLADAGAPSALVEDSGETAAPLV